MAHLASGSGDPVERWFQALVDAECEPRPKPSGGGWNAHCPAHDDRTASLVVSRGEDGRALVCCHAGCTFAAVCNALGLEQSSAYSAGDDAVRRRAQRARDRRADEAHAALLGRPDVTADLWESLGWTEEALRALRIGWDGRRVVYPERASTGGVTALVRSVPRPWRDPRHPRHVAGRAYSARKGEHRGLLFDPEALAKAGVVWVTEGPADAVALRSLGLEAVALPSAGIPVADAWLGLFDPAQVVHLLADRDPTGVAFMDGVASRLAGRAASVLRVDLEEHDDASDLLARTRLTGGALDVLDRAAAGARVVTAERRGRGRPRTKRTEAVAMLDELAPLGARVERSALIEEAVRRDIKVRTLERAMADLGVRAYGDDDLMQRRPRMSFRDKPGRRDLPPST